MNIFEIIVIFFIACWFGMAMAEKTLKVDVPDRKWDGTERRSGPDRRAKTLAQMKSGRRISEYRR